MKLYKYIWGNRFDNFGNETKRFSLKNRICKIVAVGKRRSIMVKFIDNGQIEIIDRYAVRPV